MDLIIGGKAQGKLKYTLEYFSLSESDVSYDALSDKRVVYGLEEFIRQAGENAEKLLETFVENNPSSIIICDEVGSGIVPLEKAERDYRERVGRICCALAKKARRVHRVFCGIGTVIKGG